jgi:hypothetical protein
MKRFLIGLLAGVSVLASAAALTPEEKSEEFAALAAVIRTHYGPYLLKKQTFKVDLKELVDRYSLLAATSTNLEFYYLVNRFVAEFKDSHFGARLNSNRIAKLGFIADRIQGKALIDEIDRKVLPETTFPFQKGDEIVRIGGRPVADIILELNAHLGMGNPDSGLRIATQLLGHRTGSIVPIQKGKVDVEIRRGTSPLIEKVNLEWQLEGDDFLGDEPPAWNAGQTSRMDYLDLSVKAFDILPNTEKSFRCQGTTRTFIPKDATKIMEKPFVAYYHPTPKGNVGYLRIPHYNWVNDKKESQNDLRFKQYEYAVYQLQQNTVGLIIDQDHNCGGSVEMVENMVSLFASAPFTGLQFQFLATRGEYLLFKTWMNEEEQKTLKGVGFTEVLDLMKASFQKGDRMTGMTTFSGSRIRQPNGIRYTKPVLVLTDEMSGSGGDAFPAMMQGYRFGKIMGSRTMGAGGHVEEFSPLNYSANTIRMTKSLFFHPSGAPIENQGVTPDFDYVPTRDDLLYEYKGYQKEYLDVLYQLLP